ncbi:hypothetical protein, partial [uncultured Corynebacterium sp.]|uniref:hypothetical protein n=1 Tax=uncultured Corynebacterium sp. TaxID=159447 RepID=UPI0025F7B6C7
TVTHLPTLHDEHNLRLVPADYGPSTYRVIKRAPLLHRIVLTANSDRIPIGHHRARRSEHLQLSNITMGKPIAFNDLVTRWGHYTMLNNGVRAVDRSSAMVTAGNSATD